MVGEGETRIFGDKNLPKQNLRIGVCFKKLVMGRGTHPEYAD